MITTATVGEGNNEIKMEELKMTRVYEPAANFFDAELFDDYFEADDSDSYMWEVNPVFGRFDGANRFGEQIDRVIKTFEQIAEHAN